MGKYIPVEPEKWGEMVKAQSDLPRWKEMCDELEARCNELKAEVERLKMEESKLLTLCETYEGDLDRLRKAGDDLVDAIKEMDVIIDMDSNHPEVDAWNAAKEGKQP